MFEPGTLIVVLFFTAVLFILITALLAFKLRRERDYHRITQARLDDFMNAFAATNIENYKLHQQLSGVVDEEETLP